MPDPTLTRREAIGAAGGALVATGAALTTLGQAVINLATVLDVDPTPPTPAGVTLVTGPPWPNGAQYRGAAPLSTTGTPPATEVTLRPRTVDTGAASDGHDVHVILGERLTRYRWSVETMADQAMLDALTWKLGGMAAFDNTPLDAWNYWPGGNTSGRAGDGPARNAMERLVGQNTGARTPDGARFGVYATFPVPVATIPADADGVSAEVGGADAWVTNAGHTCHWEIDGPGLQAGRWYRHRREVDVNAGRLRHWINDDLAIDLTDLPWPTVGFNRVYWSCMIGGTDPSFLPRTADRTGRLTYRLFRLERLG